MVNVLPGPYVCIELSSELMLTISLSIEQTITQMTTVSFRILGGISIDGISRRRCIPHYSAETLQLNLDEGCAAQMNQKYTALSMGGNPPMLFDEAAGGFVMAGRLFTKSAPKTFNRWKSLGIPTIGMYTARPTHAPMDIPGSIALPGSADPPKPLKVIRPSPLFLESEVSWKKVNLWHDWPDFSSGVGNFHHMFNLDIEYIKNCGPKKCYDCPTPPDIAHSWSPNCRNRILTLRAPIEITGTMPLDAWMRDQDSETRRNGYLVFNDYYWYIDRTYPVPQTKKWAEGWNLIDSYVRFVGGPSEFTSPVLTSEGPAYARYPGFGQDIFEGDRQNDVSQGLHQIKLRLKELLQNAVTTFEGGLPSENPDIFCGGLNLTDANINQILADFAKQWKEQSIANDIFNQEPPPIGGGECPSHQGFLPMTIGSI